MLDVRYGPEACKICLAHRHGNILISTKTTGFVARLGRSAANFADQISTDSQKSVTFSEDIGIFFHLRVCLYLWISIDFRFIPHQNLKKITSASITFNWRTRGSNPSHGYLLLQTQSPDSAACDESKTECCTLQL